MIEQSESNILIVDDAIETVELLQRFLEIRKFHVFTAANGEEGLEQLRQNEIDIIICDICMPKMNGLEFLEHARKHNLQAQVIIMTGNPNEDDCIEAIEKHACEYLVKPTSREDIMESIERAKRNIKEQEEMLQRGANHC